MKKTNNNTEYRESILTKFRTFLKTDSGKKFVNKLCLFKYEDEKIAYASRLKEAVAETVGRNTKSKMLWLLKLFNRFGNKQNLLNIIFEAMTAEGITIPEQEFVGQRKLKDGVYQYGDKEYPCKGVGKLRMLLKKHRVYFKDDTGEGYRTIPSDFPKCNAYKYERSKLTREELLAGYEKHKQDKYLKKNPQAAAEDDTGQLNLPFEDIQKEKSLAYARIRQSIIDHYGNYAYLDGRYKAKDETFTEKPIAVVGKIKGDINADNNPLVGKARKLTTEEKEKNPDLVSANLKDIKSGKGRVILPDIPMASRDNNEEYKRRKMVREKLKSIKANTEESLKKAA